VYENVAFRKVDSDAFRELIAYLNPRGGDAMPCGQSVKNWILQGYGLHKKMVIEHLRSSVSKIHISFDLWTSSNLLSLNGIIAHYLDADYKPQAITLATPEQIGSHAGVDIAASVIQVMKDFEIEKSKVGYFVLDNASNNDTALREIAREFEFDVTERRLRCAGHILNLIARSLLFGFNEDVFATEDEVPGDLKARLKLWRKHGPVGKAHNLVLWVYGSAQRKNRWHEGVCFQNWCFHPHHHPLQLHLY
jgi:hypothetical protein